MENKDCALVGAPMQDGTYRLGCLMGPDALRTAGLETVLKNLNHTVADQGNLSIPAVPPSAHDNPAIHHLAEVSAWTEVLMSKAYELCKQGMFPIFLGGDHSISAGTIPGVAKHASDLGQPQFVLWLDAHPDMHDLNSTESGNLHGTPVAYFTGEKGFEEHFPTPLATVPAENICMMGIRSVDPAEHDRILSSKMDVQDMRAIDENGIKAPLMAFLDRVRAANGRLHVSFDVDFLEPEIACAVGTTVPGGATFREAHLIMELLHESELVTSLDIVELNPFMDERGKTARLMVDLCGSLFGRKVLDRPTHAN